MTAWTIDLIAAVPLDGTKAAPDRVTWDLSCALARRGHRVRLLDASGAPPPGAPPDGLKVVRVPEPPPSRQGQRTRPAALGRNASDLLDPRADAVIARDAILGALDPAPRARGRPAPLLLLDDDTIRAFGVATAAAPERGLRGRVGGWLDVRAARQRRSRALARARLVLTTSERHRELLTRQYGLAPGRLALLPCAVAAPVDVGSRAEARRALRVPTDVEAVAFLGENAELDGLADALEAFRRVRPLFPGARLLAVGVPPRTEPGVMSIASGDAASRARVLRASDVALFPGRDGASGSAPREAMRSGVATIVSRHVPLDGVDPEQMVRLVPTDEPGDYASALAELFAVPGRRGEIGKAGASYAEALSFERMAEALEGRLAALLG